MSQRMEKYLAGLEREGAARSDVQARRSVVERFERFLSDNQRDLPAQEDLHGFLDRQRELGAHQDQLDRYEQVGRAFIAWCGRGRDASISWTNLKSADSADDDVDISAVLEPLAGPGEVDQGADISAAPTGDDFQLAVDPSEVRKETQGLQRVTSSLQGAAQEPEPPLENLRREGGNLRTPRPTSAHSHDWRAISTAAVPPPKRSLAPLVATASAILALVAAIFVADAVVGTVRLSSFQKSLVAVARSPTVGRSQLARRALQIAAEHEVTPAPDGIETRVAILQEADLPLLSTDERKRYQVAVSSGKKVFTLVEIKVRGEQASLIRSRDVDTVQRAFR